MIVIKEPHFHGHYLLTHRSWVMCYRFSWIWRCMKHPVQHPYQTWPLLIVGSILLLNKVFYPNLGRHNSSTWIAFQIFNKFFYCQEPLSSSYTKCNLAWVKLEPKFFKEKWYVYNIFTTNPKWQVLTSCYCWEKKK